MSAILGIDLGTATTCVAVVKNGIPIVIPSAFNSKITPSYLYVMENGRVRVGLQAKAEAATDPCNTIWSTKRMIGRKYDDPSVQECIERLPYKIASSPSGEVLVMSRNKVLTPEMVASLILRSVARLASLHLNQETKRAVITVPASFNDPQRKTTKLAGDKVGIEVVRLLNEPTAAALAWGYHEESQRTIAVYDLGGGTFDVSILLIGHGVFEVLATRGDSWLGGEDFDNRLSEHIIKGLNKQHGVDLNEYKLARQAVKAAAEDIKIELSSKELVKISIPCPGSEHENLDIKITRPEFESVIEDLVDRTIDTFKKTLEDAEVDMDELDSAVLVGGMTRLPLVRQKIEDLIGRPPDGSVNPDEAIAVGAAIHASALAGEKILLNSPASARQKPARVEKEKMFEELIDAHAGVGHEYELGESDVPPQLAETGDARDEFVVVPMGEPDRSEMAVASAGPRLVEAPLLIDVLSQSVGISDLAGLFVPLIENNSKLPAKVSQVVTTCADRQEAIRISVYQGEGRYIKDKVMLGEFVLQGIEAAPRGAPQIKVTFLIDSSGMFTVTAKDLKTNVEKRIVIEDMKS